MSRWNPGRRRQVPLRARIRLRIADMVMVAAWPLRRRARVSGGGAGIGERLADAGATAPGRLVICAVCLELAVLIARI